MRYLLSFLLIAVALFSTGCVQQRVKSKVRNSRTVALMVGHFYSPDGSTHGERPPDNSNGKIDEFTFWYQYVYYTKRIIEKAGYECIVINHGAMPDDEQLQGYGKMSEVFHINSQDPGTLEPSAQHLDIEGIGLRALNYALEQNPACVVFCHLEDDAPSNEWSERLQAALQCNLAGAQLALFIAESANARLMNNALPNRGRNVSIIRRDSPDLIGGNHLNACEQSQVPAVVTAIGSLHNPEHVRFLTQHQNAIYFAECIGHGIVNYLNSR